MLATESILKDAKNGKLSQLYLHRTQFIMFQARDISLVAEGLPSMGFEPIDPRFEPQRRKRNRFILKGMTL